MLDRTQREPIKAAVVALALDGIIMTDQDGCVLALDPAAEAMFGYSREEVVGQPIGELIVPEPLRGAHAGGLAAYMSGGDPRILGRQIET